MGKFRKTFLSLLALCVSSSFASDHSWSSFTIKHAQKDREILVRGIFPAETADRDVATLYEATREAIGIVEAKNLGLFESNFEILFDNRPGFHNGLATVIPRNFIWVNTVAPENSSSIGVSKNFMKSTLTHEMGHMFYLQKHRGIFRPVGWVFGNLSSPLGAWPRWMHEGWATWTEERFGKDENIAYLNFLKRTYAEYVSRHPKYSLTTSMLEGSQPLEMVESGEIPYAFGYNMLEEMFQKVKPEDWAQSSATSLGISFRKSALKNGFSMDEIFRKVEQEWRSEEVNPSSKVVQHLYTSAHLESLTDLLVISRDQDEVEVIDFSGKVEKPQRLAWREHNWHLSKISHTTDPTVYAVGFYSAPRGGHSGTNLRIGLFKGDGHRLNHLCTLFESDEVSLVDLRLNKAGKLQIETAPRLSMDRELAQTKILEPSCASPVPPKIESTPGISISLEAFDTQTWIFKDSVPQQSKTLINPRLENGELCAAIFKEQVRWCASAIRSTTKSRNPVVIAKVGNSYVYKEVLSATGAQEVALSNEGLLWVEKFWDEDQLLRMNAGDLKNQPAKPWTEFTEYKAKPVTDPIPTVETKHYSSLSTLWPHYWMPRIYATQGGAILSGSSWFHDITKIYEGNFDLGWDTVSQSPYTQFSLQRKVGDVKWPQAVDMSFSYLSDTSLGIRIDQGIVQAGVSGSISVGGSSSFVPRLYLSEKWSRIDARDKFFLIPSISLAWLYREAVSPSSLNVDHSEHKLGALLRGRVSWLTGHEIYSEASLSESWPLSWILHLEYANTDRKNVPYSYFDAGGAYPVYLTQPSFLSRGFAPRFALSTNIARAALTGGWTWTSKVGGLGWSRFEIEKLSQDIFVESITYDGLRKGDTSKFGDTLRTSVGSELNFWLRSFFYLKTRCFAGAYYGFGPGGETRIAVGLASNLDI